MANIQSIITVTLNTAVDRIIEVPDFAVGEHLHGRLVARSPAGKGVNVSAALARLGRGSEATGFVGVEEVGMFEGFLRGEDFDGESAKPQAAGRLVPVAGRTRENITLIDPVNHTDTHIREAGFEVGRADVERLIAVVRLVSSPGVLVVIAGSMPPGMTLDDLHGVIDAALSAGAEVALDMGGNIQREAVMHARVSSQENQPIFAVKPNRAELSEMLGLPGLIGEASIVNAARVMKNKVRWVIASMGESGAWLVGRERAWRGRLPVDADKIVNTVGCGDCLLAGVLDGFAGGREPGEALRRGLSAAAANAMDAGVARFSGAEVAAMEARAVVVEEV
jgi:1-phosphofructokinase family hexose kinase